MIISEYFNYAIKTKLILKNKWLREMLSMVISDGEYITLKDKKIYVTINNELTLLEDAVVNKPIIDINKMLTIDTDNFKSIKEPISVTYGIAIHNYLLIEWALEAKIPFFNKQFTYGDIANEYIAANLKDDPLKENGEIDVAKCKPDEIYVYNHVRADRVLRLLDSLSDLLVVVASKKFFMGPPGIDSYRKKVVKEMDEKYGKDWRKSYVYITEFEEKLKAYDREFVKDDPTYGIVMGGKILNNSRKKLYLTTGGEQGLKSNTEPPTFIETPLSKGWEYNLESLEAAFNSIRFGSFLRGSSTQEAGVDAKVYGGVLAGYKVVKGNCGSKKTTKFLITKKNFVSLVGRYHVVGGKIVNIPNTAEAKKLIGKVINLRYPEGCISGVTTYCQTCQGDKAFARPSSIVLAGEKYGGIQLNILMKAIHGKVLKTWSINKDNLLI